MKKILALTDFSACALHGVDAAIKLAAKLDASVVLYSKINIPYDWNGMTDDQKDKYPEAKMAEENAKVLLQNLKARFDVSGVKIQTLYSGGNLIDNVRDLIETAEIDLIVMGSHGASGFGEAFIGSNTQRIVRMVHSPVLVVKKPIGSVEFKNIVYASDFNTKDKEAFLRFLIFARQFDPVIHLLFINTMSFFSEPLVMTFDLLDQFKEMAGDVKCETHFHENSLIEPGIREFSEKINADLIVVSNEVRHPIKRLFRGSNVEALVNHSDIPVLSLDFKSN